MRKHFLKLFVFIIISFCFVPMYVKANEGDLRYEITEVNIRGSEITFKGWAFIHRTNNFVTVKDTDGDIIKSDGGQKVLMRAIDKDTKVVLESRVWDAKDNGTADVEKDYNFYCELATGGCKKNVYNTMDKNLCENKNGVDLKVAEGSETAYCYYEDLYFEISFNFSGYDSKEIEFEIAATNSDFQIKKVQNKDGYYNGYGGFYYDGLFYTNFEKIYVSKNVNLIGNEYVDINESTVSDTVEFIASEGIFRSETDKSLTWINGAWNDGNDGIKCSNQYMIDTRDEGSTCGNKDDGDFLESGYCKGTGYYKVKVKSQIDNYTPNDLNPSRVLSFYCPYENGAVKWVYAVGSHVKLTGTNSFAINIKNKNLCEVTTPSSGPLECNETKTFNSKCDKLTVVTSEGNADVTIEQTGHISSVLTPSSTYAGGGFNFGIMYYNTIKWNYASGFSRPSYHNLVVEKMNNKLKEYENYINNINISELMFNNELANINMVKKCSTNKNNKNYYKDELVTMCVFSFPLAEVALNGNVTYKSDSTSFNVSNKYYTPINFNGSYNITAKISGMDRIKENDAKNDSKDRSKAWTGDWNDNFTNCKINLYTLIAGIPKFIYRPIDINNPFPNRNAGVNWYDWWSINNNKKRLKETYSDLDYTVVLDNKTIADIKKYNESHNYLEWDSIDDNTKESSFIRENSSYISKVGDD